MKKNLFTLALIILSMNSFAADGRVEKLRNQSARIVQTAVYEATGNGAVYDQNKNPFLFLFEQFSSPLALITVESVWKLGGVIGYISTNRLELRRGQTPDDFNGKNWPAFVSSLSSAFFRATGCQLLNAPDKNETSWELDLLIKDSIKPECAI